MSKKDKDPLETEFDAMMALKGIVVPAEFKMGAIACYEELKRLTVIQSQPRTADSEPSNIYSLDALLRSII